MQGHPLICVIVPVYNVAAYLPRCIDSITRQTYQNLEIILVDDGSTDACPQICDEYAAKDKRIKVIHQPNKGVSAARNTGLDNARGEFISFVDADDRLHPTFYQQLMQCEQQTQADMVRCSFYIVNDTHKTRTSVVKHVPQGFLSPEELVYNVVYQKDFAVWNKLYRRGWIEKTRFNTVYAIGEDAQFVLQLAKKGGRISYLDNPLYFYYHRNNSAMHNINSEDKYKEMQMYIKLNREWGNTNLPHLKETLLAHLLVVTSSFCMAALLDQSKDWDKIWQAHALLKKYKSILPKVNTMNVGGKSFSFLFIFFPHVTRWGCSLPGINGLLKKSFIKRMIG